MGDSRLVVKAVQQVQAIVVVKIAGIGVGLGVVSINGVEQGKFALAVVEIKFNGAGGGQIGADILVAIGIPIAVKDLVESRT